MRVPASLIAIPLVAGSAAGLQCFTLDHLPLCAAAGACLAVLAGIAARECCGSLEFMACVAAGSIAAGLSLGASAAREAYWPTLLEWYESSAAHEGKPVVLEGVLLEDASPGAFGVSLALHVRAAAADPESLAAAPKRSGGVRLSVAGTLARSSVDEWRAGRRVRLTATLREPAVYLNPGVPDDRLPLARRGFVLVGSVKSGALVDVIAPGSLVSEGAAAARAWTRRALTAGIGTWSARSGGIAAAILLGDRTGLEQDDERRLQQAGTYHVIAISGGNIALLTALLLVLFRTIHLPPRAAAGATIAALVFYWNITSPASSVDRAITAALLYLAARLLDHRGPALNVLAVAAVLALAGAPAAVLDPGFILSFGATLSILIGVPRLTVAVRGLRPLVRISWTMLAATVAAETALAPVGAVLFSRMTIAGLVLNFVAIPLMSIVQAGSLLVLALFGWAGGLAPRIGYIVHLAATALVESARFVDVVPWLCRDVLPPAWWLLAIYYAAVLAALLFARGRRPGAMTAGAALACMWYSGWATSRDALPPPHPGTLRVVFFDVGQGDSTGLVLPDGRTLLVDAGGFPIPALEEAESGGAPGFDVGERVVAPALHAAGVWDLDDLIVTHADPDHAGGAQAIARLFRPRAFWEGVPVPPHPAMRVLAAEADRLQAEWRTVQAGDRFRFGSVHITVLHPPLPEWERQRVRNEDSIVLQIRYGDVSIVLPGDVGREGEPLALRRFSASPITILKAAHHGSATSSTPAFLEALHPQAVIFSAGRHNRFGHPAPLVVSRFHAIGSAMFSTAEDGAVILETDGRSVEIRGWTGRRYTVRAPATAAGRTDG